MWVPTRFLECRDAAACALLALLLVVPLLSPVLAQHLPDRALGDQARADAPRGAAAVAAARPAATRVPSLGVLVADRPGDTPDGRGLADVLLDPGPAAGTSREDPDLPEFLPWALRRDLRELRRRVRRARDILFGTEGIVDVGRMEGADVGRLRLNLQYDPDPGIRFVLLLR